VARLTAARETPGTALKPCSILATQEAHDIPSIATVRVAGLAAVAATLLVPTPSRGTPTSVLLPMTRCISGSNGFPGRVGVRGASASAGFGRTGIIVTDCAPGDRFDICPLSCLRTASGSF